MKRWSRLSALATCLVLAISVTTGIRGQAQAPAYHQIALIKLPNVPPSKGSFTYDISWVDPATHRYYLTDRANNGIDVIDTATDRYLFTMAQGQFRGFSGKPDTSGPNGIVVVGTQAWVGDSASRVKVLDVRSGLILATVVTGGADGNRADELAYDPVDHLIVIANDADDPPFLSFISTTDRRVVGKIMYPDATDGLEQPVYEPASGMFFQNVPETKANPGGRVDKIDPKAMKVVASYPVNNCHPGGLALGPQQHLLLGCSSIYPGVHAQSLVMDSRTGQVIATITQVGGSDEVWYNPGDNHYYLAARGMTATGMKGGSVTPVLGVVDAATNQWIQNVPTGNAAHSVAVDPTNNHVFVPVPNGIAVFGK
jgi:DNA-binding beta-propeller fold protein YncE